ncbi:MAG: hypothetical protein P4L43_00645 [Syntrophobacteraceae bacterium]|nr:hypothetical protein [Syntrophobacteraceae bacterium]
MKNSTGNDEVLHYTFSHFTEIARQNLMAENSSVAHDRERCAICNPGLAGPDPFPVYLEVIVSSVLVRRPRLDAALIADINSDREMTGLKSDLTLARLLGGEKDALDSWMGWVREALATGLGLLSVHSPTSLDFDLDEQEEIGHGPLIQSKVQHIIEMQKKACE